MNALAKLAAYLTDHSRVAKASIGLEIPGDTRFQAQEFFALRDAFGVVGYMNAGEALIEIKKVVENG